MSTSTLDDIPVRLPSPRPPNRRRPVARPAAIVKEHLEAARILGRPLLVQRGWSEFDAGHLSEGVDPDQVMFADFLPQDWLFPRAAAVIHHGGIGTTARALRMIGRC